MSTVSGRYKRQTSDPDVSGGRDDSLLAMSIAATILVVIVLAGMNAEWIVRDLSCKMPHGSKLCATVTMNEIDR